MRTYLILLIAVLMGCGPVSKGQERKTAIFNHKRFSIAYPDKWKVDTSKQYKVNLLITSPKESPEDKFAENITLAITEFSIHENNLDSLIGTIKEQLTQLGDSLSVSKTTMKGNANPCYQLVYESPKDNFLLKFFQTVWFVNEYLYVFTFTAEKAKFSAYKGEVDEMLDSFESN